MIEQFIYLHDYIIIFIIGVRLFVGILLFSAIFQKNISLVCYELRFLETFWTLIPIRILVFIGLPSISLLYSSDEYLPESLVLKVTGHQWYWTYDFWNFLYRRFEKDSNLGEETQNQFEKSEVSQFLCETKRRSLDSIRLLDTGADLVLPSKSRLQVLVSSADVLHSWALPNFGVKVDAIPGRINSTRFSSSLEGAFYGQCSEICGSYHRFIPIRLFVVNLKDYISYLIV